jgi:Ca-activated chloride channel family protein
MNRSYLLNLASVFCSLLAAGTAAAQQNVESINVKPGQTVYVAAIRGDCSRVRPSGAINGREFYLPVRQPSDPRATLDHPLVPGGASAHIEPDADVRREIEDQIKKSKKFKVVGALDDANFIFHVCSRYLYDVLPGAKLPESRLYDRRLSARGLVLPVSLYKENRDSYRSLVAGALWKDDAQEFSLSKSDRRINSVPPRPGTETVSVSVSAGRAEPAPGNSPVRQLVDDFIHDLERSGNQLVLTGSGLGQARSDNGAAGAESHRATTNSRDADPHAAAETSTDKSDELSEPGLRLRATLVSVPVTARDENGRFIAGLTKDDFLVLEDGVPQQIETFTPAEEPFKVVVMIDTSESTRFSLPDIQAAALSLVDKLPEHDEVMVVSFDSRVWVDKEMTSNRDAIRSAIMKTHTGAATKLNDALYLVMVERLSDISGRKAIVLLSDGIDSASTITNVDGVLNRAEKSRVEIFTLHCEKGLLPGRKSSISNRRGTFRELAEYADAISFMKALAARTGGRYFEVNEASELNTLFLEIAEELRQRYELTYYSTNSTPDGRYRHIVVQAPGHPNAEIRARDGYRGRTGPQR